MFIYLAFYSNEKQVLMYQNAYKLSLTSSQAIDARFNFRNARRYM